MKKLLLSICLIFAIFSASANDDYVVVHLPDGTEIKIQEDKAYYNCKGKEVLLPDDRYLLADGSKLTVKKSKVTEFRAK